MTATNRKAPTASKRAAIYLRVSTLEQTQTATDDKGYSIHGQEAACVRKAEEIDAEIVATYIERAESAKTADRPQLQEMLARISEQQDIDVLILYKIDRFARNRIEDGVMLNHLRTNNVQLVSVTENIDDTPAGRLMHGVLATIAEYEVANLGTRASMGMAQKARMGGTPGRAPIGYLNVRDQLTDGREHRTVAVDHARAPHIRWAFKTYATGDYALGELVTMLEARGLTGKPHRRQDTEKPINKSMLGRVLRDVYYTGTVRYKGEMFPGNHEPLISQKLFDQVQDVLDAKNTSGTRRRVHDHHLKGNLTCKHCKTSVYLTMAKNRGQEPTRNHLPLLPLPGTKRRILRTALPNRGPRRPRRHRLVQQPARNQGRLSTETG